jgi:hypothetical protein
MAHPGGRPRIHDRKRLLAAFQQYIEATQIPSVAGFAYLNGLNRTSVYEIPELADAIKRCITKKEWALERMALEGKINCTMAIFSLKQIGWKDTPSVTNETSVIFISHIRRLQFPRSENATTRNPRNLDLDAHPASPPIISTI